MEALTKLFMDPYDRPARLVPALLALMPIPVLFVCLPANSQIVATTALSIVGYCGAGYALARAARNAGKRIQEDLFDRWGGPPTTQLLRHRNNHFDTHTKARFHARLSAGIGNALPTTIEETIDPATADELYRAATVWMIGQTRDAKKFPLVFKENVAFGFHRNALGMRRLGIAVSAVSLVIGFYSSKILTLAQPYISPAQVMQVDAIQAVPLVVSVALLYAWVFLWNEAATKQAGFSYAERLIQSCDQLA